MVIMIAGVIFAEPDADADADADAAAELSNYRYFRRRLVQVKENARISMWIVENSWKYFNGILLLLLKCWALKWSNIRTNKATSKVKERT